MKYNLLENLGKFFTDLNKGNKKQVWMNGSGSLFGLNRLEFYMMGDKKKRKFIIVYKYGRNFLQRLKHLFKHEESYCEIYWDDES